MRQASCYIRSGGEVSIATGCHYNAGLWRVDLIDELLWSAAEASKSRRRKTYIGPSWSWVSIEGPIRFSSPFGDPAIKIVEVKIRLEGFDPQRSDIFSTISD